MTMDIPKIRKVPLVLPKLKAQDELLEALPSLIKYFNKTPHGNQKSKSKNKLKSNTGKVQLSAKDLRYKAGDDTDEREEEARWVQQELHQAKRQREKLLKTLSHMKNEPTKGSGDLQNEYFLSLQRSLEEKHNLLNQIRYQNSELESRINALFLEKQENGILISDGSNSVYEQRANDLQSIINDKYREVKEIQNRCNRYRSLSRRTADDRDTAEHKMRKAVEAIDAMTDDHNNLIQFYHSVMKEKEEAEKELGAEVNALDNGRATWNRRLQDMRNEISRLQKINAQQEREKQSKTKQRQLLMLQKRKDDEKLQEIERIKYLESYREELLAELDEAEHTWTELQMAAGGADTPDGIVSRYAEMNNRNTLLKDLLRIATKKKNCLQVELQQVASVDGLQCAQITDSRNVEHKEIYTSGMDSDPNSQTLEAINSAKQNSDKNYNKDHRTLGGHEKYDLNVTAIEYDIGKISASADMCLSNLVNLLEIGKQHVIGSTEQNSEQISHKIQIDGVKPNNNGKSKILCQDIDHRFGSGGACSGNSVIPARRMSACDLTATRSETKRGSLVIPENNNISKSFFNFDSVGRQVENGEETVLPDGATLMNMAEKTKQYIEDLLPQLERAMTEKVSDKSGNEMTSVSLLNMRQIQNTGRKDEAKSHSSFPLDGGDSDELAESISEAPGERRFDEIKTGEKDCTFHEILIQNDVLKEIQNTAKHKDNLSSLSDAETGNQLPAQQPRVHEDGNSSISIGANHFERAKELFEPTNLCISAYSVMEHSFDQEKCSKHTELGQFSSNKEDFESNVCSESSDPRILREPTLHDKKRTELANNYFARLLGAVLSPPERHFDPFVVLDDDEGDRTGQIWDRASVKGRSRRILNSVEAK